MQKRYLRNKQNAKPKRELFVPRRSQTFVLFLSISLLAMLVFYTVFDNQRLQVDRVDVSIPTLPKDLNGYTILPIGDLHNKMFGADQSMILKSLGTTRYDVIVFLGDMTSRDHVDPTAYYALIDQLKASGKPMYYTKGNHDPSSWDLSDGTCKPSAYLQGMLDRGVQLLSRPVKLKSTPQGSLWLWPTDLLWIDIESDISTIESTIAELTDRTAPEARATLAYNRMMLAEYQALVLAREQILPEDIHIAAFHYPLTPSRLTALEQVEVAAPTIFDADLLMAGHYHAGQFRIPPIGGLYVPASDLPRGGWFPSQESIAGLHKIGNVQQYITRGLGASGPALLRFRLFNTPEIALLRLTSLPK